MIDQGYYLGQASTPLAIADTKSGSQQAVVTFRFIGGTYDGQHITWYGSLNEGKALEITTESLKVMGYDGSDDESVKKNQVSLNIKHDTYNGKTSEKVAFVNPVGGRFNASDAASTAAAKARLKAAMLATGAKPVPANGSTDDLLPKF